MERRRPACIMGRRRLACIVTLCVLILSGCKAQTEQTSATTINKVILISIDCLRPDYLGVYNPQIKTSPHLNRLAQESIVALNATSQASTTAPSHKSILYSLYPGIHKSSMYSVPDEKLKNPMQILQSKGFTTAAFVGGGQISHAFGFGRGFHSYWEPKGKQKFRFNRTERMAVEWLEQNFQKKFFFFLHTYEVHCPFAPPDKYFQKFSSWYKGKVKSGKCSHDYYNLMKLTGEDEKFVRSLYAAEVNYVDDCLGRIFKRLKDLGIYDQTIIVVLGDHGESLGERGYYGHNQLYNIQLQIPLIIKIPNGPKIRMQTPVEAIDIMPTVFAALGLGRPFPFQGRNLLAAARNQITIEPSRPVISEQVEQYRIRIGNQTAIFPRGQNGEEEFYDISKDPEEKTNLILENRETARQFKLVYERMLQQNQNIASQFVKTTTAQPQMDEETREQLKSLGYIVN